MKFSQLLKIVFADESDFSLENRLFLSAIIVGILTSVVGTITNLILLTSLTAVIIPALLTVLLVTLYYYVRFRNKIEIFIIPVIIIALIGISVIWIFNGGINGSNVMPGFVILILGVMIYPVGKKKYVIFIFWFLNLIIYLIQYFKPGLIVDYTSETERWFDSLITLIYTSLFVYMIISYIHKHYSHEKAKAESNELKYRQAEANLSKAQRIAQVGSWELNLLDGTLHCSEEMCRIFGLEPNAEKQTISSIINRAEHNDKRLLEACFDHKLWTDNAHKTELKIVDEEQSIKTILAESRYEQASGKQPPRCIGIIQDITEQKIAEKEIIAAKNKAEESDRLKSAFLANMSHEIRTPMNGILGFADLLKRPGLSGEQKDEYLNIIKTSGDRMLNIINDIIDISKIESGQMQVVLSETNINEQAQFVYDFFKPECEAKNIELSLHKALSDNKATIITDAEKLYAVFTNLVKNSIKYTDQGKIEIGYRLSENITNHPEQQNTQRIEFYVSDTGIGIPLHRQNAIFDRFVQADLSDVRAFEGAGLGLSITKAYVEMLNGELWVKSEEKKGSVFYFTLPYLKAQTRVEELFITSKPNNKRSSKDLKVLIVDDDKTSEILVTLAVQPFSRDVLLANRGHQAIEICRQHPDIDLILMDIKMPDMDGYETTSHIRKFNEKVVIIAQTAFGLADEKEKALENGCNDFIMKPINIEQLKKLIARYFEIV